MGHGLRHPADLVAWRRWHESRHPVRLVARTAKARVRRPLPTAVDLLSPGPDADLLVAVEATHASVRNAVVAPLAHLDPARTAIVAPVGWQPPAPYGEHQRRTVEVTELSALAGIRAVLAAGHYTEIGAAAFGLAEEVGATYFVSQHGALTPFAPPLPRAAHLLAWSERDGDFWTAGRQDVEVTATGSQLLWVAGLGFDTGAGRPPRPAAATARLPRAGTRGRDLTGPARPRSADARAASTTPSTARTPRSETSPREQCSRHTPGPASPSTRSGVPLVDLEAPIVSVFSTGVLEAAARGRDAWVDFPRPPAWLGEFWERYAMHRLGDVPTPAPERSEHEPARRIAEIVREAAS